MKVADKIIDKYKPLADARDVLEARDKNGEKLVKQIR